ncbi:MAG: hypothetical protein H5U16_00865 [Roseovarius sp.]|nr:hypothetical protein [Roseovarius sp.]
MDAIPSVGCNGCAKSVSSPLPAFGGRPRPRRDSLLRKDAAEPVPVNFFLNISQLLRIPTDAGTAFSAFEQGARGREWAKMKESILDTHPASLSVTSRAPTGRGAAIRQSVCGALWFHIRKTTGRRAGDDRIAGPGGGPAMRGGVRARLCSARVRPTTPAPEG